jgi:pyridoxal phosphate enzyme (YggS family)
MSVVRENCRLVVDRMSQAAARANRDFEKIRLIAVTKTVPTDRIREAIDCGIRHIGENRLQEALPKRDALRDVSATWHFIGHLQTNKAKKVAEAFDWVQCVDRLDLAEKLDQFSPQKLPILIEVKLHAEPSKSGIVESGLSDFVERLQTYRHLNLCGLMAIPPFFSNPEESRPYFRRLRELGVRYGLPELSMGMSNDFEVAIEEGATMVRIGTALFGARQK